MLRNVSSSVYRHVNAHYKNYENNAFKWSKFYLLPIAMTLIASLDSSICEDIPQSDSQPTFRLSEVNRHSSKETGVWVTFKGGVYDISKFIANHPGGQDKILLAAGKDLEPFWNVYRQHYNTPFPIQTLESMKIGNLHEDDALALAKEAEANNNSDSPYKNDPILSPLLKFYSKQPINAEPPGFVLTDSWITPADLWFVRNHHPVPNIDPSSFKLTLETPLDPNSSGSNQFSWSLEDLKTKFPKHSIFATLQCAGNRRAEMTAIERTNGSSWVISAIANAKWTGVRLRDLLASVGLTEEKLIEQEANHGNILNTQSKTSINHVVFISEDGLEASIPLHKAISIYGDVVLAYEMNDESIPPKHGYPIRVIVPGYIGVRNVKWVKGIRLSSDEAVGPWQRGMAYKGFNPSIKNLDCIDVEKITSVQEMAIHSAITIPAPNSRVPMDEPLTIKGYALAGGGRGIARVDVSVDGGKNWISANLREGSHQPMNRAWAWTFWEVDIPIPQELAKLELVCKATDASYNTQPENVSSIWNIRGINNNAWHRVEVEAINEADAQDTEDE